MADAPSIMRETRGQGGQAPSKDSARLQQELVANATAKAECAHASITTLREILSEYRAWTSDNPDDLPARIKFLEVKRHVERQLRLLLDGKDGLSTLSDTEESLAKELQKQNELQEKLAQLFDFVLQDISMVAVEFSVKDDGIFPKTKDTESLRDEQPEV
ncbi:hypothetical protein K458DRAFT_398545 [Lentithecium fluviatile CBS 122367]|uniref:Uncharacterized protein n=1 Tax=Lentithecium fluviatile CBS 122367 TaxID=1168545 RepID=A0A6G1JQ45_9PLEO|nr:hypothetical protein K458DRAFT_398545 [Lentithecium fluviatile CBS 122367]